MRLRLRIERNRLPPVQAIWPIHDSNITVAELLQNINAVFPLEADTWGLEDYSVCLSDFGLLHYHEIGDVCKSDDEIAIRPLTSREVRSRYLNGRDQVCVDGRHIVDGVPFGKPALRGPMRPELRIPPRKRIKVGMNSGNEDGTLLLTENGEEPDEDDDEEEDDGDFEQGDLESDEEDDDSSAGELSEGEGVETEEDEDMQDLESNESGSTSSDSSSISSSDSDSASSESGSWDGIPSTPKHDSSTGQTELPIPSTTKSSLKRKRQSSHEDPAHSQVETQDMSQSMPLPASNIPHEGRPRTKARNIRRRDAKRLKVLQEKDILPPDSRISDLKAFEKANGPNSIRRQSSPSDGKCLADKGFDELEEHQACHMSDANEDPTMQHDSVRALSQTTAEFEHKRQKLLDQIAAGGVDVTANRRGEGASRKRTKKKRIDDEGEDGPPQELSSKQVDATPYSEQVSFENGIDKSAGVVSGTYSVNPSVPVEAPSPLAQRSKLDIASSTRLLFGSLGVRVPKTQEERDRLMRKLAERPKRNALAVGHQEEDAAATQTNEASIGEQTGRQDSREWREKIDLTAVECCDEGAVLSTPPFPFYQRWDPRQKRSKTNKRNNSVYLEDAGNKRRRKNPGPTELYDKYNTNGYGDALEYDDVESESSGYWEDGALLEVVDEDDDDFPVIPEDIASLPPLRESEVQKDDMITFTQLTCDSATGWQPMMVTRSAKIVDLPSQANTECDFGVVYTLQLARRDIAPVTYDDEGNRVYAKFEMPGATDEDDNGIRSVLWAELGDVRLLGRWSQNGETSL